MPEETIVAPVAPAEAPAQPEAPAAPAVEAPVAPEAPAADVTSCCLEARVAQLEADVEELAEILAQQFGGTFKSKHLALLARP